MMKVSNEGLKFIMNWEGTILKPYKDVAGIWTIGCGHVIKPGEKFEEITVEKAMELLRSDISIAESGIEKYVKVSLTQPMFDALCSFTFNTGIGALASSTLLKKLNASDYSGAAEEFLKWCKIKDPKTGTLVENKGLLNRRKSEKELFMKPTGSVPAPPPAQPDPLVKWTPALLQEAQTILARLGMYTIKVDGLYGPGTLRALTAFSSAKNVSLGQDPKAGVPESFWAALRAG